MSAASRTPAEIRAHAARIVIQVAEEGKSLDTLLNPRMQVTERRLLRMLSYGTVRWYLRLLKILEVLTKGTAARLSPEVRAVSLVGLYQLLYTEIAPHAAVAETVNATRVLDQSRASGLVNAVLRRCQREGQAITARLDAADIGTRTAHPAWLVEALRRDWAGNRYERILEANNEHPPFWLRVNRLRQDREEYVRLLKGGLRLEDEGNEAFSLSAEAPDAIRLATALDVDALPGFAEGRVSVQDMAAQLAAPLLDAQRGDRVLDACAAPGGKACHILESRPDVAELVALDVSEARMERVRQNLQRLKLSATLLTADAGAPQSWWDGTSFQRILLDVPCSATGVIRRHPDIKLLRRASDIPALAERQQQLLHSLWPLLAPGGRLLYASCSALRAENGAVIGDFLAAVPGARDVTARAVAALGWNDVGGEGRSLDDSGLGGGEHGYARWAGQAAGDGFYYACLEKIDLEKTGLQKADNCRAESTCERT
jgi:16S rRNA (cytosine967-C5)-methyltransferase